MSEQASGLTAAKRGPIPTVAVTLPPGRHHIRVTVDLDWSGDNHHAPVPLPCEVCGQYTKARLRPGVPAHRHCVQQQLEREVIAEIHARVGLLDDVQPIAYLPVGVASC